ncbi:MAG: hypothetical protein JWL69_1384 [Phycisphaerales bacterium]|nr:hypothetical protein [Phycisphaerales bacterium]
MQDLKHGTSQPPPANNPLESQYNSFSHGWLSEEVDLARVALDELLRRDKEGKLSPQHRHEIDKMALATMSAPITTPVQYYLAEELSDRLISGKLPAEDQATIYQNAVTMGLSARPVVMQWDAVPVSLTFQTRLPRRLYVEVTYKSVRIDGGEVDASHLPQWRQPISVGAGPTNVDRLISYSTLGQHRIGLDVRIDILASSTPYQGGGTIVHSETRTVSTSFSEIQPTPVVKMTRFIGDPEHEAGHYLSVGRLTHVIEFSPPYLRDLAITEMIRRGRLGELTDDQHDGLVDQLLGIQKDRNQPWNGAYGDYIESRRATMKLSDIKWREYGKQQLGFFMVARPEIRQGDPLPIGMVTVARRGNSKVGRFEASQWEIEYSFSDDVPRPWNVDPWNEGHLTLVPHWGNDFMTKSAARFPDAPLGRHTIHAKMKHYDLTWTDRPQNMEIPTEYDLGEVAFTVVPPTASTLIPIDDPALEKQVEQSIVISRLTRYKDANLIFSMRANHPPVDLAFHFSIQGGNRTWDMGDHFVTAGSDKEFGNELFSIADASQMPSSGLIFKLTPAPDVERKSPGLKAYWSKDIIIRGVSIEGDDYLKGQRQ